MDHKSWSLDIEILLEQMQIPGDCRWYREGTGYKSHTEFFAWKKHHAITWSTILHVIEMYFEMQYPHQKGVIALWDQLKEECEFMVKLNVWALQDDMAAVQLRDCKNVQEYVLKI